MLWTLGSNIRLNSLKIKVKVNLRIVSLGTISKEQAGEILSFYSQSTHIHKPEVRFNQLKIKLSFQDAFKFRLASVEICVQEWSHTFSIKSYHTPLSNFKYFKWFEHLQEAVSFTFYQMMLAKMPLSVLFFLKTTKLWLIYIVWNHWKTKQKFHDNEGGFEGNFFYCRKNIGKKQMMLPS